ncbi:MAG: heme exporter protein CcmB [Deltaproteobacteria bacterium]|nr:heme exporter protein CcmB [Deltaproteobacteria bacterium]
MRMFSQTMTVMRKDLLLEWRGRTRMLSVVLFGVVTLLLFSFAVGPDSVALRKTAAGFLVLALLLSSTLSLSESFRTEQEQRAIEGLLLLPVEPPALFYGKALSNTIFLLLLAPLLTPVALVMYSVDQSPTGILAMIGVWGLAAAALSAPGTLYAAMTSRLQSQDVLLPLLLFPLVIPVLMGTVKSLGLLILGDPMDQLNSWTMLLAGFAVIYWSICGILFQYAIEEGL